MKTKYTTFDSSDYSGFFYEDSSEESLDECFEEMGAIGKDSNSKYPEAAILTSFILKHNLCKSTGKDLWNVIAYKKKIAKKRNRHENKAEIMFPKEYQKLYEEGQFFVA